MTTSQLDRCMDWVRSRRFRLDNTSYHFTSLPVGPRNLLYSLSLDGFQKIAVLFTSSTDEISGDPEVTSPFVSNEDWMERVIAWAAERPAFGLIVRVHPCLMGKTPGTARSANLLEWYGELAKRLPPNVRMVAADDPLSSYDLMDAADLGLTYASTAGLEMLALGKPVGAVPGMACYGGVAGVVRLDDPTELTAQLDRLFSMGPSRELRRMAFRFIHRYLFDMDVPFGLVSLTDCFTSRLNYTCNDELVPGADSGLDRVCNFLLQGIPIFPPPTERDRQISTGEEDRFFSRLEADSRWLTVPPRAGEPIGQIEGRRSGAWQLGRKLICSAKALLQGRGRGNLGEIDPERQAVLPESISLNQARFELQQARAIIAGMESSKFWKLRKLCQHLRGGLREILTLMRMSRKG